MNRTTIGLLTVTGLLAFAMRSEAQSFNVDINGAFGTPSNALGAAAAQPGVWQTVSALAVGATPVSDITGTPTAATLTRAGGFGNFSSNNAGTSGDDQALMDDFHDVGPAASWQFDGLAAGTYMVFTYAWASDNNTFRTGVSVNGGPVTTVGGAWPSGYVLGTTHAMDTVVVAAGGSINIALTTIVTAASFNGVQLKHIPPPQPPTKFCRGDGSSDPCPCGNDGGPGRGCGNSSNPLGASLDFTGTSSIAAGDLTLISSGAPATAPVQFFQGTALLSHFAFGDGLRCVFGTHIRLGTKISTAGTAMYPEPGDLSIAVRGGVSSGDVRGYQVWYRDADPGFCSVDVFNITNGVRVTWGP